MKACVTTGIWQPNGDSSRLQERLRAALTVGVSVSNPLAKRHSSTRPSEARPRPTSRNQLYRTLAEHLPLGATSLLHIIDSHVRIFVNGFDLRRPVEWRIPTWITGSDNEVIDVVLATDAEGLVEGEVFCVKQSLDKQ